MMSQDNVGFPKSARPQTANQPYQVRPQMPQAASNFIFPGNAGFFNQPTGHPAQPMHHAQPMYNVGFQSAGRSAYYTPRMEFVQQPIIPQVQQHIQRIDQSQVGFRNQQSQQYADSSAQYMRMSYIVYPNDMDSMGTQQVYQASQPISHNITAPNAIQSQVPQSTASEYIKPPSQEKTKARRPIKIRDPNRGGKDITDEIINKKRGDSASTASASESSRDDKVKQEFKSKINSAIHARENSKQFNKNVHENTSKESNEINVAENKASNESANEHPADQNNEARDLNAVEKLPGDEVLSTNVVFEKESSDDLAIEQIDKSAVTNKDEELHENNALQENLDEQSDEKTQADNVEETESVTPSSDDNEQQSQIADEQNASENNLSPSTSNIAINEEDSMQSTEHKDDELVTQPGIKTDINEEVNKVEPSDNDVKEQPPFENTDDVQNESSSRIIENPTMREIETPCADDRNANDGNKTSSLVNGVDMSSSSNPTSQAPRKGKLKQRRKEMSNKGAKDSDMMSAFTDNPEKEKDSPEEATEEKKEVNEEPKLIESNDNEETWESKEIKAEDGVKTEKRIYYERDFLLEFQSCSEKPSDLADLELVLNEAHAPTKPLEKGSRMQAANYDFMPQFVRQASGGRQAGMGRSGKGSRAPVPKKIIPTSFETKIELKKSENAWVRPSEKSQEGGESPEEELYRKARGILNKLTPQNFNKLLDQMKDLKIDDESKLRKVINLVFEKAISEPAFSVAYAKFCDKLSSVVVNFGSEKGGPISFKRILLNTCQKEFEKEKTDEQELEKEREKHFENADDEKSWLEELESRKSSAKRRSLGNIRFIGELFKLKMLNPITMHTCVTKLLTDRDPESLECLCKLLTTVGKDLDLEMKDKRKNDQYMEQIDKIIAEKKVPSRVMFMLKDIKELRGNNWVTRRITDAPKTIDEIHEEVKQEQIQMQIAHQQAAQKRSMTKNSGRGSPAMFRGSQSANDEGWNHVPVTKTNRSAQQVVDPAKLKLSKRPTDANISLGPGSKGAWAQGASGGSSRFGGGSTDELRQGNRFFALSGPGQRGQQAGRSSRQNAPMSGRRSQPQVEDEKAAAVENVRRLMKEGQRTPSPSNNATMPIDEQKQQSASTDVINVAANRESKSEVAEISIDKVKKETKMTIDEFIMNNDIKEAGNYIRDLDASCYHIVVSETINIAIEKKLQKGQLIGKLLHEFVRSGLISLESFKKGLGEIIEFAEDIAVDIPHIWTNLGGVLGPIVNGEAISLNDLKTLVEPLIECNKAGSLMAEVLAAAAKLSNEDDIALLWQKSGLKWEKLLLDANDVDDFIKKNKLEFTLKQRDDRNLNNEIVRMLSNSCSCEQVIEWIENLVPPIDSTCSSFLRDLSTAVFTLGTEEAGNDYKFNPNVLKTHKSILMKYLQEDKERETEVLFAAQIFVDHLRHPQDFLKKLFETLYDEEIVSINSLTLWMDSKEVLQGKGAALHSVQEFFRSIEILEDNGD